MRAARIDELLNPGASAQQAVDPLLLMQRVADQVFQTIAHADGVLLGLVLDESSVRFVCGAGYLVDHVGDRLELAGSLCGQALASGGTLLSDDTELDPRVNRRATRAYEVRSSVCVPLSSREERIGVLCVSSSRARAFDAGDLALLGSLADILTAVIAASCDFASTGAIACGEVHRDSRQARAKIAQIVNERDFRVVLQPIFALRNGEVFGAEALVRFPSGAGDPLTCLAQAHETGQGVELEHAIIQTALGYLPRLREQALLTVNAGPEAVSCEGFAWILDAVDPDRIVVELTEQAAVADYLPLRDALQCLRESGVRLAVDDAGSGFASLIRILKLAPDIIKLDRELTANLDADPVRRSLASSLQRFAHETGAVVIAEGIETPAELQVLRELDIDHGQGFHLARPVPPDELARAVEEGSIRIRRHLLQAVPAA